eukprot:3932892-Rhodomonas_salina.1
MDCGVHTSLSRVTRLREPLSPTVNYSVNRSPRPRTTLPDSLSTTMACSPRPRYSTVSRSPPLLAATESHSP